MKNKEAIMSYCSQLSIFELRQIAASLGLTETHLAQKDNLSEKVAYIVLSSPTIGQLRHPVLNFIRFIND